VRSAPLGTPRTASRIRGSGCRRRAGARLLLAGENAFEDVLGIIHYCLTDLLRVVCDEGGRARSRATVPRARRSPIPAQPQRAANTAPRSAAGVGGSVNYL